jgi:hypothetical protein
MGLLPTQNLLVARYSQVIPRKKNNYEQIKKLTGGGFEPPPSVED